MIKSIVETGSITDIILLIMLAEAAIIGSILWKQNRKHIIFPYFAGLLAGVALVMALRTSLTDKPWYMIALFLSLSFAAHMAELILRFRGRS
jgi:hypothetical protein